MIRLGEKQELKIVRQVEFGVYLAVSAEEMEDRVLLPRKQVPGQRKAMRLPCLFTGIPGTD